MQTFQLVWVVALAQNSVETGILKLNYNVILNTLVKTTTSPTPSIYEFDNL